MCAKIFSKGIDLSEHQGTVDFAKLKSSGIDFVLLRAGYGSANRYPEQYDARFEEYYKKAKAAGLAWVHIGTATPKTPTWRQTKPQALSKL